MGSQVYINGRLGSVSLVACIYFSVCLSVCETNGEIRIKSLSIHRLALRRYTTVEATLDRFNSAWEVCRCRNRIEKKTKILFFFCSKKPVKQAAKKTHPSKKFFYSSRLQLGRVSIENIIRNMYLPESG